MNKKCLGCGSILQDNNPMLIGYTDNLTNTYCKRCFRMRNYGEYMIVPQNNKEYIFEVWDEEDNEVTQKRYELFLQGAHKFLDNI